jgi:RND family efflux transporter MFP subunit
MGRAGRPPMTVDTAPVTRQEVIDYITVVGNLVGNATVDVVPRIAGRLDAVTVPLGDRVQRGQPIAKIEDRELREQINQATATLDVNKANVAQRENDVQVQKNALDRVQASFDSGLASRQNLEDAQARHNLAVSQVDVTRAQQAQTQSRIDELRIALSNTTIVSPIDGFIARRNLDSGAFAGANTPIVTVVEIGTVRLVANLVEKGFKRVRPGVEARVEVDAFPGEDFRGQVSRVAPVFDPATRTAPMEIEVPNPGYRLKPGMYARVRLTLERRPDALTVPRGAVVDLDGRRGVFLVDDLTAKFVAVEIGLSDGDRVEIVAGLTERDRVITIGALALRDGDRIALPGAPSEGRAGGAGAGRGAPPANAPTQPARGR